MGTWGMALGVRAGGKQKRDHPDIKQVASKEWLSKTGTLEGGSMKKKSG